MASQAKAVYFNAGDSERIAFVGKLANFSGWVKERIDEAIQAQPAATTSEPLVWTMPIKREG